MDKNEKIATRYINEPEFEDVAARALVRRIYEDLREIASASGNRELRLVAGSGSEAQQVVYGGGGGHTLGGGGGGGEGGGGGRRRPPGGSGGGSGPFDEVRNVLPPEIFDELARQYRDAAADAVNDFPRQKGDEDGLTGAFGSVIQRQVRGSRTVGDVTYSWESNSDLIRGRGPDAPQKGSGADAFVEVVVKDDRGRVLSRKLLPVQAKNVWEGTDTRLKEQAETLEELFPGAGAVFDYRSDGYRATTCAAAAQADGNRRRLRPEDDVSLGDLLAERFLECTIGILGARYERDQETVVQQLSDGRERRVPLRPSHLISTEIRKK
jgi:hypothetical protein